MNATHWRFWLITLASVAAVLITLALGRWQLSRAAEKEQYQARLASQAALPPLDGVALAALADPLAEVHRRVALRGRWLASRTLFLDNRQMNARPGLYVLTPFELAGSSAVVLVQRGWVARHFLDRTQLPQIQTPGEVLEIHGRIAPAPAKLYELGDPQAGLIRQNLDLARFAAETGLPLLPVSIQQLGAASEGLLREWPQAGTGVDKHYGYAFQWFALSGLMALLYVWFQIGRRFFSQRRL